MHLLGQLSHVNKNFTAISRECLFLLTYLLFLINTVVGLIVAIWRMVITALYNIIHLGRIDISLLHRTAESYDPGIIFQTSSSFLDNNSIRWHSRRDIISVCINHTDFSHHPAYRYYTHSLKVEVSQSHPVMKAFCGLLLDMMVEGGPAGKKIRDAEEGRDPEPQTHNTVYPHIHAV